jgi:hypothetical protein
MVAVGSAAAAKHRQGRSRLGAAVHPELLRRVAALLLRQLELLEPQVGSVSQAGRRPGPERHATWNACFACMPLSSMRS